MSRAKHRHGTKVWKRKCMGRFTPNRDSMSFNIPSAENQTLAPSILAAAMSRIFGRLR